MSSYNIIDDDNIYYINDSVSLSSIQVDDNDTPVLKIQKQYSSDDIDIDKPHAFETNQKSDIIIQTDSISININNIEEEKELNAYMDNHYTNKLNSDLERLNSSREFSNETFYPIGDMDSYHKLYVSEMSLFQNEEFQNNSPISMSPTSSESSEKGYGKEIVIKDNKDNTDNNKNHRISKKNHFKRLSYNDVEKSLDKYYNLDNNKYSNEFDIMVTYLKGQKNIYIQSKNITNIKLNILFIPSLFLTAAITIFAPVMNKYDWAGILISAANALLTLTISLINYLKLQSNMEIYLNLANQYDKLETSIEITSNKLFFIKEDVNQNELVLQKIKFIENKLTEIKDSNPILIPELIKTIFPVISHINIFSFIKKIETYKKKLIIKFRDIKNEIGYIIFKWKQRNINIFQELETPTHEFLREQKRLFFLLKIKEKMKDELIHYKNAYVYIDDIISKEIRSAESYKIWWAAIFCRKTNKLYNQYSNPVIQSILNIIFFEE